MSMYATNEAFVDKLSNIWRSKTIWFNAGLAALIPILPELINLIPQLEPYLPTDTYKTLTLVGLVGNVVLRFMTTKSLAQK